MATKLLEAFAATVGFWVVSILSVFNNKGLVGNRNSKDDVTLFVAWFQCTFTVVFALALKFGQWMVNCWKVKFIFFNIFCLIYIFS